MKDYDLQIFPATTICLLSLSNTRIETHLALYIFYVKIKQKGFYFVSDMRRASVMYLTD